MASQINNKESDNINHICYEVPKSVNDLGEEPRIDITKLTLKEFNNLFKPFNEQKDEHDKIYNKLISEKASLVKLIREITDISYENFTQVYSTSLISSKDKKNILGDNKYYKALENLNNEVD